MIKYPHLVQYVAASLWAIVPARIEGHRHASLEEILHILAFKAAGGEWSAAEIQARIGEAMPEQSSQTRNAIAVIPLRGVIANRMGGMEESSGGMSCERFLGMFRQAMANDAVGSIVIDCDSPGGTVEGVPEAAAEVLAARGGGKRIVAHVNSLCASAALYICKGADEIAATSSSWTGSIGVYSAHEDLSKMLEQEGIKVTLFSAGKYKVEGNPFEPMSDEAKAWRQTRVDKAYAKFVQHVAQCDGVTHAAVRNGYGQGRVLDAKDALAAGLIDRIGTLNETITRLAGGRSARSAMRAEGDAVAELDADADRARRFRVL